MNWKRSRWRIWGQASQSHFSLMFTNACTSTISWKWLASAAIRKKAVFFKTFESLCSTSKIFIFSSNCWRLITLYSQKPFFYNIGGENYTLDCIKHGMLRGNKRKPGYLQRVLSSSDPKINKVPNVSPLYLTFQYIMSDPRVLFICLDYPDFVENVSVISGNGKSDLNESLD